MRLEFDQDLDANGNVIATHVLHTELPEAQAMLAACKGNAIAQTKAGYAIISKHKRHAGKSRWQALIDEATAMNDPIARGLLGV